MRAKSLAQIILVFFVTLLAVEDGFAVDIDAGAGFDGNVETQNVAGGFDYLPNGDVLAFPLDFVGGPDLYRFDANGDGDPTNPEIILDLDATNFGQFVQVAPNGQFALVATTGAASTLRRVDLSDFSVSTVVNLPGVFDIAFIDNESIYVSANSGGFNPAVPNQILQLDLDDPTTQTVVAEIAGTPSGPIALNSDGDLFYVKGTFAFPAPPQAFTLLKFAAEDLANAIASGTPLAEADAEAEVALDGGFDIEINTFAPGENDIYISDAGTTILKLDEETLTPAVFATLSDSAGPAPSGTYINFSDPTKRFLANGEGDVSLGVTVAANFFAEFLFAQLTPLPLDSDGDGVLDVDEIEDGTDPNDPGSVSTRLRSPVFTLWNGFLEMINILELVNVGASSLEIKLSLFQLDGTLGSTLNVTLQAGEQFDVILNDLVGFAKDSFGLVTLEYDGSLDGRLLLYRNASDASRFDFAVASPLSNPIFGKTAATFNTFQPTLSSAEADNTVEAWLSIVNLADTAKSYTVRKHDQTGALLSERRFTVASRGRVDVEAGHVEPGPNVVGLAIVEPDDDTAPYLAQLVRYGRVSDGGYNFAFSLLAKPGTGRTIVAPVSNQFRAQGWLEVVNCSDETVRADLECYSSDGSQQLNEALSLPAFSQIHTNVSSILAVDASGVCRVIPNKANSIIAQAMRYYRQTNDGSLLAVSGSELREVISNAVFGSYNLFLEMENVLRLLNPSNTALEVTVKVLGARGTNARQVTLPPFGLVSLDLHDTGEFSTSANTYGVVTLEVPAGRTVLAETVRTRATPGSNDVDYNLSTLIR